MARKVSGIQIEGLEELQRAFKNVPEEVNASVIRNIARKPANKVVSLARKMFTIKKSGASKRSLGILKVKNNKQKFIEIGIKGRSLAYIFMFWKGMERKKKSGASTGEIKPVGNVIQEAAGQLQSQVNKEISVDITKVIAKAIKRYAKK
jgi:ethanolamine utilization microcompartment shell protein EutL